VGAVLLLGASNDGQSQEVPILESLSNHVHAKTAKLEDRQGTPGFGGDGG
jgi:hypothetical protein